MQLCKLLLSFTVKYAAYISLRKKTQNNVHTHTITTTTVTVIGSAG